jgi:hypothetical protein
MDLTNIRDWKYMYLQNDSGFALYSSREPPCYDFVGMRHHRISLGIRHYPFVITLQSHNNSTSFNSILHKPLSPTTQFPLYALANNPFPLVCLTTKTNTPPARQKIPLIIATCKKPSYRATNAPFAGGPISAATLAHPRPIPR